MSMADRTLRPLVQAAVQWGLIRAISKSTVHRWLSQAEVKPHRVRRWLHSLDPEFRRKLQRIVRLYLHSPRGARVLCVDEKCQRQIQEHLHPVRPLAPGTTVRIEQTYRRTGQWPSSRGWMSEAGRSRGWAGWSSCRSMPRG